MKAAKHSRLILVDGQHLRWWYRFVNCPCCGPSTLVISHESRKGSTICAQVSFENQPQVITPVTAERVARAALAKGWVPGSGKGRLVLGELQQVL